MLQNRDGSSKSWLQKSKAVIIAAGICFSVLPAYADEITACHDGDTCHGVINGQKVKIRLWGVDAPEIDQPFGTQSRDRLTQLVVGKPVTIKCYGVSYDRKTCDLFVGQEDVSAELVREGFAWDYPEFSHRKYKALEQEAKQMKIGLWAGSNISSPYCYRWTGKPECNKNMEYQP